MFVAQHRHRPDQCPASPGSGPLLLSRVSAATAARYGVTIEAEALIDGEHLLLLVVQAASQQAVERFLAFLPGSPEVRYRKGLTMRYFFASMFFVVGAVPPTERALTLESTTPSEI